MTEPEVAADSPKPKRKFVKKNVTVQKADIVIGASFPGKVVRAHHGHAGNPIPNVSRRENARGERKTRFPERTNAPFFQHRLESSGRPRRASSRAWNRKETLSGGILWWSR